MESLYQSLSYTFRLGELVKSNLMLLAFLDVFCFCISVSLLSFKHAFLDMQVYYFSLWEIVLISFLSDMLLRSVWNKYSLCHDLNRWSFLMFILWVTINTWFFFVRQYNDGWMTLIFLFFLIYFFLSLAFGFLSPSFLLCCAVTSCSPGINSIRFQHCICLLCFEQNGVCQVCSNLKWAWFPNFDAVNILISMYTAK